MNNSSIIYKLKIISKWKKIKGKKMRIGVIGAGYVGLITAAGFAYLNNTVFVYDINKEKIATLKDGKLPFYEDNLEEILTGNIKVKKLNFTYSLKEVIENSDYIFIAVGTPPDENGFANLKYLFDSLSEIAKYINDYKIIIIKSTVPPGTCKSAETFLIEKIKSYNKNIDFDIVSNPEFLREGNAIYDFLYPDRIIIGTENERAKDLMVSLYKYFIEKDVNFVFTNFESSELIKYASNSFLATKISFINELSILAEKIGANIKDISKGMGYDKRIGDKFLEAGCGYGGSCFPKDTSALYNFAKMQGLNLRIVESAILANKYQIEYSINKILNTLEDVNGKVISILGLTFKPNTDDVRESPAIYIVKSLINKGAIIKAYCPKGIPNFKKIFQNEKNIIYKDNLYDCLVNSEACVIVTEWKEFKEMDLNLVNSIMKDNYLFDLRNIFYSNKMAQSLFKYFCIGTKKVKNKVII
jgi:UDPglucose 6-dehydrogenase